MHSLAIRDLKNNPSEMTRHLENNESVFVTKHGKPIGLTLPLGDDMLSLGLKKAAVIDQYSHGLISIGKVAELLEMKKNEVFRLFNDLRIDYLDYDKDEINEQVNNAKDLFG